MRDVVELLEESLVEDGFHFGKDLLKIGTNVRILKVKCTL